MAGNPNNFVDVTITIQDAVPDADSFGVLGILAHVGTSWVGWREFSNDAPGRASLVTAGVPADHPAYKMLEAAGRQNPHVPTVKIYARPNAHAAVFQFVPTPKGQGYVHSVEFSDGTVYGTASYTEAAAATAATIVTGMAAAIASLAQAITVDTAATTSFSVTHTTAAKRVYFKNASASFAVTDISTDTHAGTDLAAAIALDPDFYGLVLDSTNEAANNAAAAVAETNQRLFFILSCDTAIGTNATTDLGSDIEAGGYHYSSVWYSDDPGSFLNVCMASGGLAKQPGSSSFANKNPVGVTPSNLDATFQGNAKGKNVNLFQTTKGLRMTEGGMAGSGRFLDLTFGVDWLRATIISLILQVMANLEKIPYTNEGAALIEAQIRAALDAAVAVKFIKPDYTVTIPRIPEETLPTDRALRYLPNISFSANAQGAIHKAGIGGTIKI